MMTLEEAIQHCREKSCGTSACNLEHQQLAEWLEELKEYRENARKEKYNMTREEIVQAISDDKMMPFIQPEQLSEIVNFVIKNYKSSLPSNLDEAAEAFNREDAARMWDYEGKTEGEIIEAAFKAGAEWMTGQGYTSECTVYRTPLNGPAGISMNLYECDGFKLGDRVIVQIRRK